MRRALHYAAAAVCLAAGVPALLHADAAAPRDALAAAAKASRTTNFQGVLLYRSDNAMEVMQVVHRYHDKRESEHLLTLTGEPRELIREGDRLTCILPKDRRLTLQRPPTKNFLTRLDGPTLVKLAQWYAFESLGLSRVAGRECMGVAVKPLDAYRYGYEVWMDQQNHLPLRVILRDEHKRVLEQVMFTEISFPTSIPDSAFKPSLPPDAGFKVLTQKLPNELGDGATTAADASSGGENWRFDKLPPGFSVTLRDQREMPDGMGRVDHLLISDGLSSVSVFAAHEPSSDGSAFEGLSRMGSVHAFGRRLDGYQVTVVGEAPGRTVQMIGDAIQPQAAPADATSSTPP